MSDIDYAEYFSSPKDKALVKAIMSGDSSFVRRIASGGGNLTAVGQYENTPMRVAVKSKQKELVRLLLELHVNPNFKTPKGSAVAADVVIEKDPQYLKMFLDHGLGPNLKCDGVPLMFYAVSEGNWQQYDMLLAKGADINSKRPDGTSLVVDLVMQLEYDRAKELVLKGADCRAVSKWGLNLLDELVDAQSCFCTEPNLPDCRKRAELLRLMQQRGIAIPPGLPYL